MTRQIFIKPLPDYLLNGEFWEKHVCDDDPYPRARGLLLSYSWLIQFKSDFLIAKTERLIPESLETWEHWVTMMEDPFNQIQPFSAPGVHSLAEEIEQDIRLGYGLFQFVNDAAKQHGLVLAGISLDP